MSLKTRSITGILFGTVMIFGTIIHPWSSALLYFVVGLVCFWEFFNLVFCEDGRSTWNFLRRGLALVLGLLPALALAYGFSGGGGALGLGAYLLPLYVLPLLIELFGASSKPFQNAGHVYLGLFYLGLPTALLTYLSLVHASGPWLILGIMLLVWTNDVFAYLVGSKLGKTKLIPRVSPGKTWEGSAGGWISTMILAAGMPWLFGQVDLNSLEWAALGLCAAVFGSLGDLVESILKRSLGIKDSGNILPGHGGFLDRFDAFLLALPFAAYLVLVIFQKSTYLSWPF